MRMIKRFFQFSVLFFLLVPVLIPMSGADEVLTDLSGLEQIEIENRRYVNQTLSFNVKLSGETSGGTLYSTVFAENGQVKGVTVHPANNALSVSLPDVQATDYVKVIWTDQNDAPVSYLTLRMAGNYAEAYAQFVERLSNSLPPSDSGTAAAVPDSPYSLSRLLVSCNTPSDLDGYGAEIIPGPDNLYVLQFRSPGDAERCAEQLKALPSVRYAEPDGVTIAESETQETSHAVSHSWGVPATALDEYAEYLAQNGKTAKIVVAVVDSGLDANHEFLKQRALPGYDFVEHDDTPQDPFGHGAHVAGTIVDATPGMNVQILPVRVLNSFGSGRFLDIALGIRYAADHGANVINLSLTSPTHSETIDDAIQYAVSKNVAVVAAAGNYNYLADAFCPAHMKECVTVAAVDSNLQRHGRSNYGDAVDIAAPGVAIESCAPGGGYVLNSGTSMAAPHVSAAAALLLCERGTGQTPAQIARLLRGAASELPPDGDEPYKTLGAGFLNMRPFILRTISLYSQGALLETRTVPSESVLTLNAPGLSRDGYAFRAWTANADGSGASYPADATLTVTKDLSLHAQWDAESGFYALLYPDGELTFQENRVPRAGATPIKTYPVAVGQAGAQYAAWHQERDQIRTVVFADTLQPTSTASWFHDCANLSEIRGLEHLDASQVTDMSQMFSGCVSLQTLDLSAWNTASVTNLRAAFFDCDNLLELDLTGWNTANVTDMEDMFSGCDALKTVYVSETFTTDAVSRSDGMFGGCTSIVGGRGTRYDGDHTNKQYARIDGGANSPGYFTLQDETENLSAEELFHLGEDYFDGKNGKPRDYEKSRYYYEKSAAKGNMYAINDLGYIYQRGYGVAADYAKALRYYEQAAEMGNPHALNNLGYMYENGLGVTKDYQKAADYYQQAADKGSDNAASNLLALRFRMALGF